MNPLGLVLIGAGALVLIWALGIKPGAPTAPTTPPENDAP